MDPYSLLFITIIGKLAEPLELSYTRMFPHSLQWQYRMVNENFCGEDVKQSL